MTQSTTGLVEIKGCPFCGGNKIKVFEADDIGGWLAGCCAQTWGDTEADAIEAWNTRPTDPTIAELVAALEGSRRAMRDMIVGIGVHNDRAIDRHVPIEGPVISALIDAERQAETALTKSRSAL